MLEQRARVQGIDVPETVTSKSLADSWSSLGMHAAAADLLAEVLEQHTWVLGATHPETLASVDSSWEFLGRHAQAAELKQVMYLCLRQEDGCLDVLISKSCASSVLTECLHISILRAGATRLCALRDALSAA